MNIMTDTELLALAAERYMLAVKRLGEDSGYNKLTFFEAPISKMPNDGLGVEAANRWRELNDAGKELTKTIAAVRGLSLPRPDGESQP